MVLSSRFTELICDDMTWSTPTTSRSSSCSATWWTIGWVLDVCVGFLTHRRAEETVCSLQEPT